MANAIIANLKKGALHKELGVKSGSKIPAKKLKVKSGMSTVEKKRMQFAINAKKFNHKGKSGKTDEERLGVVNS